jgi:hypothetical protein
MKTQDTKNALLVLDTVNQAIKNAGQHGIPSGHLYSMLMEYMSLHTYQAMINVLVQSKQITNKGHLLTSL